MNKTRRAGIRALADVSGVEIGKISSYHLGFIFGPRMNAAGRLEHAARSLELLLTSNAARAHEIAEELDGLNRKRQADQARILAAAAEQAEQYADDPILVLAGEEWSHGIVGIVASKLVERFRKPALVMQIMEATTKGSARSLGSFNLVEALRAVGGNFIKFGGHHYAAGYTLKTTNINQLRQDINEYARSIGLTTALETKIGYDLVLPDFSDANWDLLEALEQLEPFGNANPKPRFESKVVKVTEMSWVGQQKNHLRLSVGDGAGNRLQGIAFDRLAKHPDIATGDEIDIVYQIDRNEFNGKASLQILIQNIIEHK
jgi:single-stranded-DNA-specific exonuclease